MMLEEKIAMAQTIRGRDRDGFPGILMRRKEQAV